MLIYIYSIIDKKYTNNHILVCDYKYK